MIASVPTVIFLILGAILALDIFILSNIFKIETYNYDVNIKTNINFNTYLKNTNAICFTKISNTYSRNDTNSVFIDMLQNFFSIHYQVMIIKWNFTQFHITVTAEFMPAYLHRIANQVRLIYLVLRVFYTTAILTPSGRA